MVQSIGPEGPPPQHQNDRGPEIAAAFQNLWMMLQLASEYDPNQPDHGRSSARIALIGVMNFLAVLFPQLDTLPLALQDLLQGLVDLDQGTVVPLLARADLRGRPPTSFSDALLRGLAAAALTRLVDGREMPLKEAAAYVARRLNGLGYGPKRLSGVQVAKWRENVMAAFVSGRSCRTALPSGAEACRRDGTHGCSQIPAGKPARHASGKLSQKGYVLTGRSTLYFGLQGDEPGDPR